MTSTSPMQPPPPRQGPHFSPPPLRPPPSVAPLPPTHGPGALGQGAGYNVTGSGKKHKLIYRVGSSSPGSPPLTTDQRQEVVAALQKIIQDAENQSPPGPGLAPPPVTATVTVTHEPVAVA